MFISLVRFPTVLADRQKVEFLMEVMFLSRRMHESVPIRNQHTSTGRDWQSAAVGQSSLSAQVFKWGPRQTDLNCSRTDRKLIWRLQCGSSTWAGLRFWFFFFFLIQSQIWNRNYYNESESFTLNCTIFHAATADKMYRLIHFFIWLTFLWILLFININAGMHSVLFLFDTKMWKW